MARRYKPDYIGKIFDEIEGQNDRAAIIVGLSLVEHFLNEALETKLPPLTKRERADLFSESGIFASFSQKILGAQVLGLIGPKTRRELDLLRLIRNEAAHNMNPVTFDTPSIKSRAKELTLVDNVPQEIELFIPAEPLTRTSSLKDRFIMTLRFLTISLWLVRRNWENPVQKPFKLPDFLRHQSRDRLGVRFSPVPCPRALAPLGPQGSRAPGAGDIRGCGDRRVCASPAGDPAVAAPPGLLPPM